MGKGGHTAEAEPQKLTSIRDDPAFARFLSPGFQASKFASDALAGSSQSSQVTTAQLQEGIRALTRRLKDEVSHRQPELLQQAVSLRHAEDAMQGIAGSVEALQGAMQRVRGEVSDMCTRMRSQNRQAANLHAAADLVRALLHRLKLANKLKALLTSEGQTAGAAGVSLDLAKAAKLLAEIAAADKDAEVDLSGLQLIAADAEFVASAGHLVRSQAQEVLQAGMRMQSQAEVGSALQVFHNLHELQPSAEGIVEGYVAALEQALAAALDPRKLTPVGVGAAPGGSSVGATGRSATAAASTAKLQDVLWARLGEAMQQLHASAVAVWHLQRVLAKKRDPLSHDLFIDVVQLPAAPDAASPPLPCDRFWARAAEATAQAMAAAFSPSKGGFVREALTHSYPRLAALLEQTLQRILTDTQVKGVGGTVTLAQRQDLVEAARPFQNAYLAAALSRLSDAVTAAFPGGSRALPTSAELQKCIARMHEQLKAGGDAEGVAVQTAACVGKAVRLLAEKAEYMAATGPELRQVTGSCTSGQARNMQLCCHLQEVHRSLAGILPRLPPAAASVLAGPLNAIKAVAIETVMPLFRAAVERAEELLLRLHSCDFSAATEAAVTHASAPVTELAQHLLHCRMEYFSRFVPTPSPSLPSFAGALLARMAARIFVFTVRHAALLRPLSQPGKLQLAKDLAEVEVAVGQHIWPLQGIGPPHGMLRSLRPFLFLETSAIAGSPLAQQLPATTVLHHLYSRAPVQLQPPHERSGLTPAQYSLWLDQHSMPEALEQIRGALDACAPAARGQPEFEAVFPLMLQIASGQQVSIF